MKLNLHPKGIPKQEPLGADTPLKKGGVVVGMRKEGDKEKIYFVGDDCHLLCVGATRSGKSRCLVLESICLLGLAGESIFCSDPKAELFHYLSLIHIYRRLREAFGRITDDELGTSPLDRVVGAMKIAP